MLILRFMKVPTPHLDGAKSECLLNFAPCVLSLPYLVLTQPLEGNGLGTETLPRGEHLHRSEREATNVLVVSFFYLEHGSVGELVDISLENQKGRIKTFLCCSRNAPLRKHRHQTYHVL